MPDQKEQIERLAERIWTEWLNLRDMWRIAEQFGYPKDEYGWATQLDGLKWSELPENVKNHVRDMAEEEIVLIETTPQTEVTRYLITLFRELERLRPTICGAMSHGIAWDDKRERLALLVNLGDFVYAHRLRPDDLATDPVATAAKIMAKVEPELSSRDGDFIAFKR